MLPALVVAGLLAAGCSSSGTPGPLASGAPAAAYPPTDPLRIELLPWAPARDHERVAEITIVPARGSTRAMIEASLMESAAAVGGHAVFVVSDPGHRLKLVQVDPLPSERSQPYPTNGIVAVAIRYP